MGEGRSCPAPATLPDDDDLLREFLLRLPPLPSSLPRAALVCKRWRRLLSDPQFLRRFRAHHRTPPMLGFFRHDGSLPVFTPTLAIPDRIPPARFSFQRFGEGFFILDCRHGLALLFNRPMLEAVVWDPITGRRHRFALPSGLQMDDRFDLYNGAVLRNDCSGAFKVVMVPINPLHKRGMACLYDSESGEWGNIIQTDDPILTYTTQPSVLVANTLCWLLYSKGGGVLQFDTDKQNLDVIQMPMEVHNSDYSSIQLLRTVDGALGFAMLSEQRIQLWCRTAISDHVFRWALQKTIELDKLISLRPSMDTRPATIVGFDEDNNVIFLWMTIGVCMIQLESMKVTNLPKDNSVRHYHPYTSFYTAGLGIGCGDDRAEVLNTA